MQYIESMPLHEFAILLELPGLLAIGLEPHMEVDKLVLNPVLSDFEIAAYSM